MRVFHSAAELPAEFGPSAVSIGNFDGVHKGHREIMRRLVRVAQEQKLTPVVLTFDPHPARVLAPERAPQLITTVEQRVRRLGSEGVEAVLLLPFSLDIAKLSPEEFARQILAEGLRARVVMVGEDFRFGYRQSGHVEELRTLGEKYGFDVRPVEPIAGKRGGERVSSTVIRSLVREGRVSRACRLMGAPFALEGNVVAGFGVGRKQTVPTLNIAAENELLPRHGVYVTRARDRSSGACWRSITNVGMRPTFNGDALTVETFLLEAAPATAPARIEVEFLAWVRPEKKFETPAALKAQILRDAGAANRFHKRLAQLRMA